MRWLIAILLFGLLLSASPAFPADMPRWTIENPGMYLQKGQPAPEDGAFFAGESAIELLEKLRDAKAANEKVGALLNELEFKEQQVNELLDSKKASKEALDKANRLIENLEAISDGQKRIINEYKILLAQSEAQNKQLSEKLEKAESRTFWDRVWMGILIIGMAVLGIML